MKIKTYLLLLILLPVPRRLYGLIRFSIQQRRFYFFKNALSFQFFQIFLGRIPSKEKSYRLLVSNRLSVRSLFQFDLLRISTPQQFWSGRYLKFSDWSLLPTHFILKNAVASGNNFFVDKNVHSRFLVNLWLLFSMPIPYSYLTKEWYYSSRTNYVAEQIIVSTRFNSLVDYKFFCSNGVPFLLQVDLDRSVKHKRNLYLITSSTDYQYINATLHSFDSDPDFVLSQYISSAYNASCSLSTSLSLCRVDFYIEDEIVIFGEITNVPGSGFERFSDSSIDNELGSIAISYSK